MKTLAMLKKDMEFNKGLSSLIETLKTIAVTQFKILEQKLRVFTRFTDSLESFFELLDMKYIKHPFTEPGNKAQAVVAVTSDTGLLGGLNMQVINYSVNELTKIPGKLIVIGERGKTYVRETGIPFVAFTGISDEDRFAQAMQLRDYLVNEVLSGSFGHLKVVFPRPISFTVQRVEIVPFLPFQEATKIAPKGDKIVDTIYESHPAEIVEYLAYLWMGQKLYEIFGLSRLAEFAARYVHLEDSAQKLKEMSAKTQAQYFRVRHELIDRNMREVFASRLMYSS